MKAKGRTGYEGLDLFRVLAALLVIGIHTSPLTLFGELPDFIFTRILGRVAVPFFFLVTGFFLFGDWAHTEKARVLRSMKKIALWYGISVLLYIPVGIYTGYWTRLTALDLLKDLLVDGTMYHLWYFPAVLTGMALVYVLMKNCKRPLVWLIVSMLYVIGLGGDSYYGLISQVPALEGMYDLLFSISAYTRNGVFFAPVFLVLGAELAREQKSGSWTEAKKRRSLWLLVASGALLFVEALWLHGNGYQRHDSMYVLLLPVMYGLFPLLCSLRVSVFPGIRDFSMYLYILHPLVIILVRGGARVLHLQRWLVDNSLLHYLAVCAGTMVLSFGCLLLLRLFKRPDASRKGRAWAEVSLAALRNNVEEIRALIPDSCEIMAVVKANAYGCGSAVTGAELARTGIEAFAVAALKEGVALRKQGIQGEILILGYTDPADFALIHRYHLTQTVVDCAYGRQLNAFGKQIKVHVKIDTGMHRLGEDYRNVKELKKLWACKHLAITGTYTHLCVADSRKEEDVAFTKLQIARFYAVVKRLQEAGCDCGRLHIQSSYGILNYPELECDYVRPGIILYGAMSTKGEKTCVQPRLQPVLSIRARVAEIRTLEKGQAVSYGRTYEAQRNMKTAVLSIGYADGIPRALSGTGSYVLIHGKKAEIIGRICMDQMVVDVTEIPEIKRGDIATIVGKDGREQIAFADLAVETGTITNELMSRLGSRLEYVVVP